MLRRVPLHHPCRDPTDDVAYDDTRKRLNRLS